MPAASVATKVFRVVPTGKLLPDAKPAIWVIVAPGQLSVTSLSYSYKALQSPGSLLTVASLSKDENPDKLLPWTLREINPAALPQVKFGSSVSVTFTVKEQVAVLPATSVAWKTTVLEPTGKALPDAPPEIWEKVTPGQLSEPEAVKLATAEH